VATVHHETCLHRRLERGGLILEEFTCTMRYCHFPWQVSWTLGHKVRNSKPVIFSFRSPFDKWHHFVTDILFIAELLSPKFFWALQGGGLLPKEVRPRRCILINPGMGRPRLCYLLGTSDKNTRTDFYFRDNRPVLTIRSIVNVPYKKNVCTYKTFFFGIISFLPYLNKEICSTAFSFFKSYEY